MIPLGTPSRPPAASDLDQILKQIQELKEKEQDLRDRLQDARLSSAAAWTAFLKKLSEAELDVLSEVLHEVHSCPYRED